MGAVWLVSALLLVGSAVAFGASASWCWIVALLGAALSQLAIASSWSDARFGTLGNLLAVLVAAYSAFAWGPLVCAPSSRGARRRPREGYPRRAW
jgi:hypothetical protein